MTDRHIIALTSMAALALVSGCAPAATLTSAAPAGAATSTSIAEPITPQSVGRVMDSVAAWQYAQFDPVTGLFNSDPSADGHPQGWVPAVLYVGLVAHARNSGRDADWAKLLDHARNHKWGMAPRLLNADDYAIGQLYLDLAKHYRNPEYAKPVKERLDRVLAANSQVSLEFIKTGDNEFLDNRYWAIVPCRDRWCWCDALFMAPPVLMEMARYSGDDRYAKFADREFRAATEYLYDREEKLYHRDSRFFAQRDEKGRKIFWGRGNGWTIAGLARTLDQMPASVERGYYEQVFRESAERLAGLQTEQGYWTSSLLANDKAENPETSGTALITYALAWGVNKGLLNRAKYEPVIDKGWRGLVQAVHPDGKLGYVQQVAAAPGAARYEDSQLYGVGGFLMAGEQVARLKSRRR